MQFKSQICNGNNVDFFRRQKHHFQLETHHYAVGRRERTTGCTVLNIHLLTTMQLLSAEAAVRLFCGIVKLNITCRSGEQ